MRQNHLRLIENYQQYEQEIHSLLESIMTSFSGFNLLTDRDAQIEVMKRLSRHYPFVELIYSVDPTGIQMMETVCSPCVSHRSQRDTGKGLDRSHRPYMLIAGTTENKVSVTHPYLSSATHQLALSSVQVVHNAENNQSGYLVMNFNLHRLISYLKGDQIRAGMHPLFQSVYAAIGGMLVVVSMLLIYAAGVSLWKVFRLGGDVTTRSFGIVILITLGLAIFDLGKTILEEEVLSHKDIHHNDTSRRTITRFMSAIVIAVSIESLLLMFKSLLVDSGGHVLNAVWMLLAAVALLMALGVYLKLSKE